MDDLYLEAARAIQRDNAKEGSLKTLVYSAPYRNLRQLFALVSESVKYQSILRDVLGKMKHSFLNEEFVNNNKELAIVLLYEQLVGNGFGRAGNIRRLLRTYKAEIKSACDQVCKENNAASLVEIVKGKATPANPRYARVNFIKGSVQEAIDKLTADGWEYIGEISAERFQQAKSLLGESQFARDPMLDDVLVFRPGTDLHSHRLVMEGYLVLQDRASCVPAHVLNPPAGCVVLDCCAAPGNKTSHLASLMRDQGRIIALDRDAKRMAVMKKLLQRSGASSVETITQDFLTLDPRSEDVADIDMILVDPSCSGSGMSYRDVSLNRIETLKRFQSSLLKHALRFPNVSKVTYSTCSIHQQENEEVVEEVMRNVSKYFRFVPVLPTWSDSRGLPQFPNHQNFLRLSADKDLTGGFFVACFERIQGPQSKKDEQNELPAMQITSKDELEEEQMNEPGSADVKRKKERHRRHKEKLSGNEQDSLSCRDENEISERIGHGNDGEAIEAGEIAPLSEDGENDDNVPKKKRKKKHKHKERNPDDNDDDDSKDKASLSGDDTEKKSNRKHKHKERCHGDDDDDDSKDKASLSGDDIEKKSKRKHKEQAKDNNVDKEYKKKNKNAEASDSEDVVVKENKKLKDYDSEDEVILFENVTDNTIIEINDSDDSEYVVIESDDENAKIKRKKKHRTEIDINDSDGSENHKENISKRKKKKKRKERLRIDDEDAENKLSDEKNLRNKNQLPDIDISDESSTLSKKRKTKKRERQSQDAKEISEVDSNSNEAIERVTPACLSDDLSVNDKKKKRKHKDTEGIRDEDCDADEVVPKKKKKHKHKMQEEDFANSSDGVPSKKKKKKSKQTD